LLEGLEISEINLSDLERTLRVDAEFYSKENLIVQNVLIQKKSKSITEYVKVSDGNHMSISEHYVEEGIPYYRGGDIYNFFIEQTENPLKITKSVFDRFNMKRSHLQKGDVLISIVGAIIGNLSLVKTNQDATCSCKLAILRPKNISPELISVFLKTKFGQSQIQKFRRGTGQTGLILEDFDQIIMPKFKQKFSDIIQELINDSFQLLENSKSKYNLASKRFMFEVGFVGNDNYGSLEENLKDWVSDDPDEQLLANLIPGAREELEMLEEEWDRIMDKYKFYEQIADYDNQISYFRKNENRLTRLATLIEDKRLELKCIRNNRNIINYNFVFRKNKNIKSFKESFGTTGRLDAEYYQQKYEFVIELLQKSNYEKLVDIVSISKSIEPGSAHYSEDEGLPFYRVSDLSKFGMSKPDKTLTDSFVKHNSNQIESLKPQKDTILFSKDGSVGTAYLLGENLQGITSGAILHLKIKDSTKVLPAYLTLVLNSKLVQMQAERDAGGSIILHWRVSEIENVIVPIVAIEIQEKIAELVEESFALKSKSEQLLSTAKRAVEMAIEEGEEVALAWIEGEVT
jgi:restriction endonuclease S subunit